MSKKQLPKGVTEILTNISLKIKECNTTFGFQLVAKNTDDFFFQINSVSLGDSDLIFSIIVNPESTKIFSQKTPTNAKFYASLSVLTAVGISYFYLLFDSYLESLSKLYPIDLDLSNLFDLEEEQEELIPEPDFFESEDKILPYSLKQITIKDFQGIKATEIDNIPVDTQWIFLVGENGFGKTTILQSIFLGLHGALDGNTNLLEDKNSHISVEYKNLDENVINYIIDNKNPLIHLAAYGPGRLNLQGAKSENVEDRNNSISYNLFNSDGFLFNINADFERLEYKDKRRFNLLKRAICTLIPNLSDIRLNKESEQIEYIEREITNGGETITYKPLPFKKLASGFKSIIALAGDMIVRLSKNQLEVKDPSQLKGIVIIDEIDLHLHPKLQKQLIGQFSKVFPKIQFIVSTHSPIPLLGAESNTVILKVNRTEDQGIQIEHVKVDLKNLTPNLVLTSGIFDMEDFLSVQNENLSEVRTEDSVSEMNQNDKVAKHLEEFEKSEERFPDELFLPKIQK
jgi:predicted ATPase